MGRGKIEHEKKKKKKRFHLGETRRKPHKEKRESPQKGAN